MIRGATSETSSMMTPISSWFADAPAIARFRRRLRQAPVVLSPRDDAWRAVAPGFVASTAMAASGLPFQVVADRRVDRSVHPRRLRRALAEGKTILLPQVHQVLPRLMRLMVALRVAFLGPFREECAFLFLVDGRGRAGMGLHHDGEVDAFWLQLEGRRTVTLGPPVARSTPEDLDDRLDPTARGAGPARGWSTRDLGPGTLLYLPPRTPHRVVCHGRSLALTLTWKVPAAGGRRRRSAAEASVARARARAAGLLAWDVVSGYADAIPRRSSRRLWTQVPAVVGPVFGARGELPLWTPGGGELWLPAATRPLASGLAMMPSFPSPGAGTSRAGLARLREAGILGSRDLPLRIIPDDPAVLDGWRFG